MKKYLLILCFYIPYQIYYSYWFFDIHNKFKKHQNYLSTMIRASDESNS